MMLTGFTPFGKSLLDFDTTNSGLIIMGPGRARRRVYGGLENDFHLLFIYGDAAFFFTIFDFHTGQQKIAGKLRHFRL